MNDNETRVYENHAQDARVREVGERDGGGLPVYRTDRRELSVGEREQSNNHRSAGGAVMDRANREAAQTPLKKGGGVWVVQGNVLGRSPENGPGGCGYSDEEVAYTLNTIDRMAVCVTVR